LNPKSEIETGNLPQSLGRKRIEKISTDHFVYASIFSIRFCSNILRHLAVFNFAIRAISRNHAVALGSAVVPTAVLGVPPKTFSDHEYSLNGDRALNVRLPGGTPARATGTVAQFHLRGSS
jgi:hypothetical protein